MSPAVAWPGGPSCPADCVWPCTILTSSYLQINEHVVEMGPVLQLRQRRLREGSPLPKATPHINAADLGLPPELRVFFSTFPRMPPRGLSERGGEGISQLSPLSPMDKDS